MLGLLNLALLAVLVAMLYGPVSRQITILGVLRHPAPLVLAEGQGFYKIEDTMQCEDLHYWSPTNKVFAVCEDSVLPRFKWFPPVGNFEGPATTTGSIHVIDPQTMKASRLAFENFAGPFVTHGFDVIEDPETPNAVYIFAVNHLSNPDFYQAAAVGEDVPRARSQVELFHHVLESSTARHVRSIRNPLIATPNDIYAESPNSFFVTNDHLYRTGYKRMIEDVLPLAKWSSTIHVQIHDFNAEDAAAGIDATVALTGLYNNNGLGHGKTKDEMLVVSCMGGTLYRAHANSGNHTITLGDAIRPGGQFDNPSYYSDPYRTASHDASGYVLGGMARPVDLAKHHSDPAAKDGAIVFYVRPKSGSGAAATEWESRVIFQDDGTLIRTASSAVLVPIETQTGQKKKAWLFVSGFFSESVIAVEVEL
ncbi:serum paraoxonase/arylesterase family protein [Aspergillus clavatus NRRL 1]|uniref:Serum paraoxonase/arylesterase family protein n=1 Tax=Aspergillus clavatus (strain ATCC 1007 / CBS 513.65 / DSM 816 / NCTC 3887 / NRRL 1 / QM 1276 / 107) TaxID=344612 RepID=A1CJ51_ASPCL|nr:serum paraoxonase/arylesterase family protein [Aspergillus clavatus NRRL 1]EAW09175.1 serum paraoxonase/arylesterase family protein [Aspergillus clavatus NRRL 1]